MNKTWKWDNLIFSFWFVVKIQSIKDLLIHAANELEMDGRKMAFNMNNFNFKNLHQQNNLYLLEFSGPT